MDEEFDEFGIPITKSSEVAVSSKVDEYGIPVTPSKVGKTQPPSSPAVGGGSKLVGGAGVRSTTSPSLGGGTDFGFGGVVEKIGMQQQAAPQIQQQPSEPSFGFGNVVEQVGKPTITSEEIKAGKQKEKAAKVEEPSVVADVFDSFLRGSARLGQSLAETPAFIYDLAAKPQNYIADKFNLPGLKASSDQLGKMIGVEDNVIADYYKGLVEESQTKFQQKYDKGITDYISNGEYSKAFGSLANQIAESAPITISLAMGNAAGITTAGSITGGGLVFGAQKKAELDKEAPWMSESDKLDAALMNGLAEGVFEQFGLTKIGSVVKNVLSKSGKDAAREIAEKGFKEVYGKVFRQYFGTTMEEGLSEAATTFAQNAIDKYSGAKPNINLWDNVSDSFIVGLGSGGVIGGVPVALQVAQTKKGLAEQEKINQQKAQLNDALVSDQIPDEAKRVLVDKVKDLNEQEANILLQETSIYNSLDAENKGKVDALSSDEDGIKTALADENLQPEVKSVLEEKLSEIGKQKDEILATAPESPMFEIGSEGKTEVVDLTPKAAEAAVEVDALKDVESTAKALDDISNTDKWAVFLKENLPILPFSSREEISEAYHDDKAAGKETELTKAVEGLLQPTAQPQAAKEGETAPQMQGETKPTAQDESTKQGGTTTPPTSERVTGGEIKPESATQKQPSAAAQNAEAANRQAGVLGQENELAPVSDGRKKEMKSENDKLQKRKFELASERDDVVTGEGKYKNFNKKERDVKLEEIRNEVKDIDAKQVALQKELKVIEAKETGSVELFDHPDTNHGSTNTIIYDIKNDKLVERENVVRGKTKDISVEDAAKQKFAKTLRGRNQREINEAYTDKEKAKYEAEINDEIAKYSQPQTTIPAPPTSQSVSIFQELDKVPSQSKGKRAKAERAKFDKKHGEKAKQAKDINDNFAKYEKQLMDEGVITKKEC